MTREWFILAFGAWVLLSPWLLGFSGVTLAKWSNVIVGIVLVLIPVWKLFGEEKEKSDIT